MSKDDATWLSIAYALLAVIFAYLGFKAIGTLGIQTGWMERYDSWFPYMNMIGAVVFGVGLAYYVAADKERKEYHLAVIGELRKVTWPSFDDTKRMTWIVVIVVALFSAVLAVFDLAWAWVLEGILV